MKLGNYIQGNWIDGDGDGTQLLDAVNGSVIAAATAKGIDLAGALDYGRKVGNPALRKMTFQQRGLIVSKFPLAIRQHCSEFRYVPSYCCREPCWTII